MSHRRIVVGIDFGTTYSGLAWAETGHPSDQHCIQSWPTQSDSQGQSSPKVPTELRVVKAGYQWGFQIKPPNKRLKNFKLRLDDVDPNSGGHSAEDLTREYLSQLCKHLITTLQDSLSARVVRNTPIDFVLTVPAIWSDKAKDRTKKAAIKACTRMTQDNLYLVSEPEAAAFYTLQKRAHSLQKGGTFVVCDAGGGTVDLISYTIAQLSPELKVKEAAVGSGKKCGSSILNKRFRRYIKEKLPSHIANDVDFLHEANDRFDTFKKEFTPSGDPLSIPVALPNDRDLDIRRNRWRINQKEMSQKIFEPIIQDVLGLVAEQIQATGTTVSAILLVGGFGSSKYLKSRIETANPSIPVYQPTDGWTSIVRGACILGLGRVSNSLAGIQLLSRKARKHYGMLRHAIFETNKHDGRLKEWVEKDQCYRVPELSWFIKRGELMRHGEPIEIDWYRDIAPKNLSKYEDSLTIYCNDVDAIAPIHKNSNTFAVGTLEYDLSGVRFTSAQRKKLTRRLSDGKDYFKLEGTCIARYESAVSTYSLSIGGLEYDVITVKYD